MSRHPDGRKRARAVISVLVGRTDLVLLKRFYARGKKRKVPHSYSGAEDNAPEWTEFGMTILDCENVVPTRSND